MRTRLTAIIFLVLALSLTAKASYVGKGEVRGRVIESYPAGGYTSFRLEIESQNVTGPELGSPNSFLYRGTLMDKITPGSTIHLWFEYGADIYCDPCGLYVKKVEFADGRIGAWSATEPATVTTNKSQMSRELRALLVGVAILLFVSDLLRQRKRMI